MIMDKQNRVGNILKASMTRDARINVKKKEPIKTGIMALDQVLGGIMNGQLIAIGGRPSIGKTALALNIAINTARAQKTNVLYFSLETPRDLLVRRIWGIDSNIDYCLLRKKLPGNKDRKLISKALKALAPLPLYIYDKPRLSTADILYYMDKAAMEGDLGLVVIDYLSLLTDMTNASKIKDNMTSLKYYAEKLGVPIIITAQLNRGVDLRKFPQDFRLSDFRGSKAIGNTADTAIFIYRKNYYTGQLDSKYEEMQLTIANNPGRKMKTVPLLFERNTTRISKFDHSILSSAP